jgi:hypothetical protein
VRSNITLNQRVLIPIGLAMFALSLWTKHQEMKESSLLDDIIHCLCFFLFGCFFWTMLEYKEHRFTLHNFDTLPEKFTDEKHLAKFFFTHHLHHMFSNQEYRIVIPLWHVAKVIVPGFLIEYYFFGLVTAAGFNSGLVLA